MNDLKINIAKKEPQKRNRKVLKELTKFAKKNCSQTGVKEHKGVRQLPFHCDPNINDPDSYRDDVFFASLCFPGFVSNEIENYKS